MITDYVEGSRSFNHILQISWPFLLSKIVSWLEKPEPILRSKEEDSNEGSHNETVAEREPSNVDDIKAWDSVNEHMSSILRLTITGGAARSVLLQFESKYGKPGDGKQAWQALRSKYQNSSRQRTQNLLRCLDNSVMKADTAPPDVFLSQINQIRDELSVLDEVVSTERLTTIILDALPDEMYSIVKLEGMQDPN